MAPQVGFEPTTDRLTADCSTTELLRITFRGRAIASLASRRKRFARQKKGPDLSAGPQGMVMVGAFDEEDS